MFICPEPLSLPSFAPPLSVLKGSRLLPQTAPARIAMFLLTPAGIWLATLFVKGQSDPAVLEKSVRWGLKAPDLPGNINPGEFSPAKNYYPTASASADHEKGCDTYSFVVLKQDVSQPYSAH